MNGEFGTNGELSTRQPWLLAFYLEITLAYLPV